VRYNQEGEMRPWLARTHPRNLEVLAHDVQSAGRYFLFFLDHNSFRLSYLTSFCLNELWRTTSVGDKMKELDLSDSNPPRFDSMI